MQSLLWEVLKIDELELSRLEVIWSFVVFGYLNIGNTFHLTLQNNLLALNTKYNDVSEICIHYTSTVFVLL